MSAKIVARTHRFLAEFAACPVRAAVRDEILRMVSMARRMFSKVRRFAGATSPPIKVMPGSEVCQAPLAFLGTMLPSPVKMPRYRMHGKRRSGRLLATHRVLRALGALR